MIRRIDKVRVCGPHSLRLVFNDGTQKTVNVLPLLAGPVFAPLREPTYFRRARLDPVAGTVVWPNGADLAPEALYDLPDERKVRPRNSSPEKAVRRPAPARRR